MTDTEINVAIAEACGWKRGTVDDPSFSDPSKTIKRDRWIMPSGLSSRKPPDYCSDLNAMHEAEMSLTIHERSDYTCVLNDLTCMPGDMGWGEATAVARQRAEAFLRVKGLWKK